jgi:CopG family transcriptional regulator/antitoxin EndoAI
MNRRLNISLPEETIRTIDMVIQDGEFSGDIIGDRNHFINKAVRYYINKKIEQKASTNFNEELKKEAIQRAQRDLELAEE